MELIALKESKANVYPPFKGLDLSDDVTVYIGKKDELVYVKACLHIFRRGKTCAIMSRYMQFMKSINVYYEVIGILDPEGTRICTIPGFWTTQFEKDGRTRTSKEMGIAMIMNGNAI